MAERASLRAALSALAARLTKWAYQPYPPIDADGRDPYRWCIYCGCDCYEDDPDHRLDCPHLTGMRPIRPRDLGMRGPHDPYAYGMRCMDCGVEFNVGDLVAHRPVEDGVLEAVCIGCRVLNPGLVQ